MLQGTEEAADGEKTEAVGEARVQGERRWESMESRTTAVGFALEKM